MASASERNRSRARDVAASISAERTAVDTAVPSAVSASRARWASSSGRKVIGSAIPPL